MRTIDRIRKYIGEGIRNGSLRPGSRLPSCHEFMTLCSGSYATVRSSLARLQSEGLVQVENGVGTFLAGGDPLPVRLNVIPEALSIEKTRKLFERHLAGKNLNIDLEICSSHELASQENYNRILGHTRAAITMFEDKKIFHLPQTQLSHFPDYGDLVSGLRIDDEQLSRIALPFCQTYFFMVASGKLMKKIGFSPDSIDSSFDWWEEYVEKCRKHRIHPMSLFWAPNTTSQFTALYGLFFSILGYEPEKLTDSSALFDSPGGRRFLKIINDIYFYPVVPDAESFYCGGSGMCPYVGNWFSVQNHLAERPDVAVDDPIIIPFGFGKRKIFPAGMMRLEAYLNGELKQDARNRVWALMKLMFSREFQLDYSNCSGLVSSRRNIAPSEYQWNRNHFWDASIPEKGDLVIYGSNVFSQNVNTALTLLLEDYRMGFVSMDSILHRMDLKKSIEEIKTY
ncbi:MAG: Bacterial regulatory proteins, gntR family [Lentisphaerae bacterium ADurb.Bin242]|nr:MAG: Bacterial regulatory proteins, gntR family [Lentisphaerae bacterium ADurb.Bin242]